MQPELINIENRMKQIVCYLMLLCACMQLQAQTYDELITCALDAAKNDSLTKSEILFKQALKMDRSMAGGQEAIGAGTRRFPWK